MNKSVVLWLLLCSCQSRPSLDQVNVDRMVQPHQAEILATAVGAKPTVREVFVFGDSLSDTGRLHEKTFGLYLPDQVYWHGRASNGPLWIDYLCGALNCTVHNYAVAGAATNSQGFPLSLVLPTLSEQLDDFTSAYPKGLPADALAVIWIGANNYIGADMRAVQVAVRDIREAALRLLVASHGRLLLGTMPDLSGILHLSEQGPHSKVALQKVSLEHNQLVRNLVVELQKRAPKQVGLFDAYVVNEATIEQPAAHGFAQLHEACYQGDYQGHFTGAQRFCKTPLTTKMWDDVHPNSRMQCHYAVGMLAALTEQKWLSAFAQKDATSLCVHLPQ